MEPSTTAQTRANILTALKWLGVNIEEPLQFSEEPEHNTDRSRVVIFDPHGLILRHIKGHPDQWTQDSGKNHNKWGWKVRVSYRSKTKPSLQMCRVDIRNGEYDYMLLTDLDEANPFCDFPDHCREVLWNMAPRLWLQAPRTTDPIKIAEILARSIRD